MHHYEVQHIGQPFSMDMTMSAQLPQKHECPRGTRDTPASSWTKQTLHLSYMSNESVEVVAFPVSIHWRWTYVTSCSSCRAICMSLQIVVGISCRPVGMSAAGSNGSGTKSCIAANTAHVFCVISMYMTGNAAAPQGTNTVSSWAKCPERGIEVHLRALLGGIMCAKQCRLSCLLAVSNLNGSPHS